MNKLLVTLFSAMVLYCNALQAQEIRQFIGRYYGFTLYEAGDITSYCPSHKQEMNGNEYHKSHDGRYGYRQDGNKIYCYTIEEGKETLVMDFGLEIGDAFALFDGLNVRVEEVTDTLLPYGRNQQISCKKILLRGIEQPDFTDTWIEDIGSLRYGLNPPKAGDTRLIYACRYIWDYLRDKYEYQFDFHVGDMHGVYVPLGKSVDVSAFNNDKEYQDACENKFLTFDLRDDTLYVKGYIAAWCDRDPYFLIERRLNDIFITSAKYYVGSQQDCTSVYPIDLKIPGFTQGEYTVHYEGGFYQIPQSTLPTLEPIDIEGKAWHIMTQISGGAEEDYLDGRYTKTVQMWIESDTVVDGTTCKKLYTLTEEEGDEGRETLEVGYCQQVDEKYYQNGELMFDFGMQVGDVMVTEMGTPLTVKSIGDTVLMDGVRRKYLLMVEDMDAEVTQYNSDYWVEGIGSLRKGIYSNDFSSDGQVWTLQRFSYGEKIIYSREIRPFVNQHYSFMLCENNSTTYYWLDYYKQQIDRNEYYLSRDGRYGFRQDGNRIYCYTIAEGKETMVMDFGLEVGDVFPLYEGFSLEVEMISDTLISSDWGTDVTCKRLHLRGVEQPAFRDMWVEGFGSVRYGINPPKSIDKLLCSDLMYAVSDEFIYMVNFSRDDKWGLEVPLGEEHPNIDLPYPPYRWQNDSVAFTLSDGRLNIDGYVWNDCFGPLYMLIREEGETITINTYELPDYADCYSYYKTNVTVAGLDQDRYTLLYNGKNLELAKDSTTVLLPVETTQGNDDTNKEPDNPNTDQDTLAIKNFTLNVDVLNLLVSETFQLKLTWDYPEAEDIYAKHVAYSYNDRVISIDSEGLITARSEGQTDVQVSCLGVEKSFKVIVKENTSTSVQHRGRMTLPMGTFCDDKGNNFNVTLTNNTLHLQGTFWGHACIPSELNYEILDGTAYFTIHTNQEDSTCTDGYQGSFAISQTIDVEFADCVSEAYNVYVNNTLSSIYAAPEQKVYYVCATRIEDIESLPNDTPYYDLQGRKVVSPTRGIYIKDGKKMVIK